MGFSHIATADILSQQTTVGSLILLYKSAIIISSQTALFRDVVTLATVSLFSVSYSVHSSPSNSNLLLAAVHTQKVLK
jgi:hypothetical protein